MAKKTNGQPPRSRVRDLVILLICLILLGGGIFYYYQVTRYDIKHNPKYNKVSGEVGPQFEKLSKYLDKLARYYKGGDNIPRNALRQEENKLVGEFFYYLRNVGVNDGVFGYCLVAEHYKNHGRAYYSSVPVNNPTWDGKRSYYHYVFGVEPQPDLNGPCNASVIHKVKKN